MRNVRRDNTTQNTHKLILTLIFCPSTESSLMRCRRMKPKTASNPRFYLCQKIASVEWNKFHDPSRLGREREKIPLLLSHFFPFLSPIVTVEFRNTHLVKEERMNDEWTSVQITTFPLYILFLFYFAGILVNLHHSTNTRQCGGINLDVVQQVVAAKWAVDIINNRSLSHEPKIGK